MRGDPQTGLLAENCKQNEGERMELLVMHPGLIDCQHVSRQRRLERVCAKGSQCNGKKRADRAGKQHQPIHGEASVARCVGHGLRAVPPYVASVRPDSTDSSMTSARSRTR